MMLQAWGVEFPLFMFYLCRLHTDSSLAGLDMCLSRSLVAFVFSFGDLVHTCMMVSTVASQQGGYWFIPSWDLSVWSFPRACVGPVQVLQLPPTIQ